MTFSIPSPCCGIVCFSHVRYKRINVDDGFLMVSLSGARTSHMSKRCMWSVWSIWGVILKPVIVR
jgi:hypothetical protein